MPIADPNGYQIEMMFTKRRLFTFAGRSLAFIPIAFIVIVPLISRRVDGAHQRNVIGELDRWAVEYSLITDRDSAIRAACMIEYASNYYTPCDGYRTDPDTEQPLQVALQRSVSKIAHALSE